MRIRLTIALALAAAAAVLLAATFWPRPPADDPAAAAREDRERGDALLRAAREQPDKPDVNLLAQAAERYRACLAHEATPAAEAVFAGARHNLEMAKLLLAQTGRPDLAAADGPKQPGDGDRRGDADAKQSAADHRPGDADKGAADAKSEKGLAADQKASADGKAEKQPGPGHRPDKAGGGDRVARADKPGDRKADGKPGAESCPVDALEDGNGEKSDQTSSKDATAARGREESGGEKPKPDSKCPT
jgi:hypothetical protein